jgi:large subunit ribosomal protein L5
MDSLKEKYKKSAIPALKEKFGYKNEMATPRILKIVVNVGAGLGLKDPKFNEAVENTIIRITGQRPVKTLAKQSISNFKIRKGQIVGLMVTLRGKRMYDFLDKLINITLPRVRDFRGLDPKSVDNKGSMNLGFKEHISFPEIKSDEVERIHGLQVSIVTSAKSRAEGMELLKLLGIPFQK